MLKDKKRAKLHLNKLAEAKMPYGKYKGRLMVNLPDHYFSWLFNKGFPEDSTGKLLQEIYELKLNGLEYILRNKRF